MQILVQIGLLEPILFPRAIMLTSRIKLLLSGKSVVSKSSDETQKTDSR